MIDCQKANTVLILQKTESLDAPFTCGKITGKSYMSLFIYYNARKKTVSVKHVWYMT